MVVNHSAVLNARHQAAATRNRTDFTILDETDDYIVVDKPAPLQVHPSKPTPVRTLWDELRELLAYDLVNGGKLSIINRLDRETSGVVLVAKHAEAARQFSREMQAHRLKKTYFAIVQGWPETGFFRVDRPILRQGEVEPSAIWLKRKVHPKGQSALTECRVLERCLCHEMRLSLVEVSLITGRMHQIRVHLSHAGFPVLGDKIYGNDETCYLRFIEKGWTPELARQLILPRHALHAWRLETRGPPPNQWTAMLPTELTWQAIEDQVGKALPPTP